jgi:DNA (cytosine-5)-methyltransferase 1
MALIGIRRGDPPGPIAPSVSKHRTVRDAFSRLPRWGSPGNDTLCTAGITPAKRPVMRPSPWQGSLLFNGNGRPLKLDLPSPTLPASMGGNATPIVDQRELDEHATPWIVNYHRRLARGGAPVKRVPRHLRRITVEEAAELQSFPLGMTWFGTSSAKYRQIGNAVPPRLALHLALAVATALGISAPTNGQIAA